MLTEVQIEDIVDLSLSDCNEAISDFWAKVIWEEYGSFWEEYGPLEDI